MTPHGSAAKFICPQGVTYANPLTGIGPVMQIGPPSTPINYFAFLEGPIWIGSAGTGTVFFSDNASSPQERIFKVVPPSTSATQFMDMSGSNGLAVDNADKLVVADQRNKRITRVDPMTGTTLGTIASTTAKPNDVIVRSDDNVYFSDPAIGFFRISPTGTVSAAMKINGGGSPNGLVLSPDENTLYVGDVNAQTITKFTLAADGTVMESTAANFVIGNGGKTMTGTVDGMCVDCAGNVYAGTSNGVEVYSAAGAYIGTVATGYASNCTFGGPERRTMYVTSQGLLKYVTLNVPGLPD
jgi:gluconolactonase